jgi:NHL repeat
MRVRGDDRSVGAWLAGVFGALLCALVLAFNAGQALGLTVTRFSASIGSAGSGDGQLNSPNAVAVNLASHDIYVADMGNHRVVEFSATGTFIRAFGADVGGPGINTCTLGCVEGTPGSGPGAFVTPSFVAVDNSGSSSAGDVYVADTATKLVQKFDASDNLIASWGTGGQLNGSTATDGPFGPLEGIAVDGSGNLVVGSEPLVIRGAEHIFKFAQDGSFTSDFVPPRGIAQLGLGFDGSGDLFEANPDESIEKLKGDGTDIGQVTTSSLHGSGSTGFGVDPENGDLYNDIGGAIQWFSFASCTPAPFSPCTPAESFGSGHLISGRGLAVDPSLNTVGPTIYAADAGAGQVQVFGPVVLPDVTTGSATNVTLTSATLNGTVNPSGVALADCHFDVGTDTSYTLPPVPCSTADGNPIGGPGEIPADSNEHTVSANITGLTPGVAYHFRLAAANANGPNFGSDVALLAPSIDSAAATKLTPAGADLTARVNPNGLDTTYHFEWGTTSCASGPCASVPVPDGDIDSGAVDVAIVQHLSGLSENTTYHWRVLATSARGTTTGVDHTFVYDTTGQGLPDGRVYEMVTPDYTEGQVVRPVHISTDGTRFIGESGGVFAGAQNDTHCYENAGEYYFFERTGGGWQTTPMSPPATDATLACMSDVASSPDLSKTLWENTALPAYQFDLAVRQVDGTFTDVGPTTPTTTREREPDAEVEGVSEDLSHVLFSNLSNVNTTRGEEDPYFPFDPTLWGPSPVEYVGTGNAAPQLIAVTGGSGSTEVIGKCGATAGGYNSAFHAMSTDGGTVFFTPQALDIGNANCNGEAPPVFQLFARIDGARTVAISERSQAGCTGACQGSPPSDANFEGASADGSKAFFTSTQQLLDGASEDPTDSAVPQVAGGRGCAGSAAAGGCNLYEYDFGNPSGHELVLASAGSSSPRVQGVVRISDDGSHVYFVAKGVLTPAPNAEDEAAVDGAENLYVFERDARYPAGHIAFIADLCSGAGASGDVVSGACPSTNVPAPYGALAYEGGGGPGEDQTLWRADDYRPAQTTPDGRFLLFTSRGQLTADTTGQAFQVFLYDALTGALTRVSRGEQGFNDNGNGPAGGAADAFIVGPRYDHVFAHLQDQAPNWRAMSDDGSYVFFQSPRALTPQALNDVPIGSDHNESYRGTVYAQNVYEFHDGHISLISDGRDTNAAATTGSFNRTTNTASAVSLIGTDASGMDVFFTTADRLVPGDTNTTQDVYDVRIGGGFPEAAGSAPCQSSEACHQGGAVEGSNPSPATSGVNGSGNLTPEPPPVSKPAARKRTKAVKGCRAVRNRHKRAVCERSARRHHGAKSKKAGHATTTRKGGK